MVGWVEVRGMMDGEVGVIIARAGDRRPAVWRNMQKAHGQRREEAFQVDARVVSPRLEATCIAVEAPSPLACLKHLAVFAKVALVSRFAFVFGRFLFSSLLFWKVVELMVSSLTCISLFLHDLHSLPPPTTFLL